MNTPRFAVLDLPAYYDYDDLPVKLLATPEGGLAGWAMNLTTGGWAPANHLVLDVVTDVHGRALKLTPDEFVSMVELTRATRLRGDGPVFALYETVNAIKDLVDAEGRDYTDQEALLLVRLFPKTYRMFEQELAGRGDPAAEPDLLGPGRS